MTDVNIAVELLSDAFRDSYETAILISADSDLCGAVQTVRRLFPEKRVIVAFPPKRFSFDLVRIADASFTIGVANLRRSQFPDRVVKEDGFVLERPEKWRK